MTADSSIPDWRPILVRFCGTYLPSTAAAEDVAQEVCIQAAALEEWPARTWLFTAARHRCLNVLRGEGRRPDGQRLATGTDLAASAAGPLTRMVKLEDAAQVKELLGRLSDAQREVLLLRYAQGLGREEIAAVVGETAAVVKSRLYEGLNRLRELAS